MVFASDDEDLDRAKTVMRLRARAARRAVLPEMRVSHARAIADRMLQLPQIVGAATVMLYGASPEEADPSVLEDALRRLGKRIAYPRVAEGRKLTIHWVDSRDVLAEGPFGLLQPTEIAPEATLAEISAIVVPGVAYDGCGNRLGFGGGYYDTLLAGPDPVPTTIGMAYDEQVFDEVPHEERDHAVDILVTPTRTVWCATSRP
jgi:5-formyltetrahydrofolate cyclo-ligase